MNRKANILLLLFVTVLPAMMAFAILYRNAFSFPCLDDYHSILAFATDQDRLPSVFEKILNIAAAQHNEYKLIFLHLIVFLEMGLTHHLNFGFLMALGNLFLFLIGCLLWLVYTSTQESLSTRLLTFLPISFLFFSLNDWETLDFAMAGIQNLAVIFFSLLAIYLLTVERSPIYFTLAVLSALLATCSSANGFLLAPIGLLILLSHQSYRKILIWSAPFALLLVAYLYRYTPILHVATPKAFSNRPLFFLGFVGGALAFNKWDAAIAGVLILILIVFAVYARYDRVNPAASFFTGWILLSGLFPAWVRGGEDFFITSRYSIYSNLLLVFCYAFTLQYLRSHIASFNHKVFSTAAAVFAAFFCMVMDVWGNQSLGERKHLILTGMAQYRVNPTTNSPLFNPDVERLYPAEKAFEHACLNKATQTGIYALPEQQKIDQLESWYKPQVRHTEAMAAGISIITRDPEILGGTPCFRGTRVPFKNLLDQLETGETLDEFLDDFPSVTREMPIEALETARDFCFLILSEDPDR